MLAHFLYNTANFYWLQDNRHMDRYIIIYYPYRWFSYWSFNFIKFTLIYQQQKMRLNWVVWDMIVKGLEVTHTLTKLTQSLCFRRRGCSLHRRLRWFHCWLFCGWFGRRTSWWWRLCWFFSALQHIIYLPNTTVLYWKMILDPWTQIPWVTGPYLEFHQLVIFALSCGVFIFALYRGKYLFVAFQVIVVIDLLEVSMVQ